MKKDIIFSRIRKNVEDAGWQVKPEAYGCDFKKTVNEQVIQISYLGCIGQLLEDINSEYERVRYEEKIIGDLYNIVYSTWEDVIIDVFKKIKDNGEEARRLNKDLWHYRYKFVRFVEQLTELESQSALIILGDKQLNQ